MKKTNFEKLKELKEYEAAQMLSILPMHVMEIQQASKADVNLDAFDLEEDSIEIITSWLKDDYDEEKGFKLFLSGGTEYITEENLSQFEYLSDSHEDYSDYFKHKEDEE